MEYFEALGLKCEPFSSSPDPDMFFRSNSQQECLHQLEIAIRLRRGLNVVLGESGTGKTTICRRLLRELTHGGDIDVSLILDPGLGDPAAFVARLAESLHVPAEEPPGSTHEFMERIKSHLFDRGVIGGRILCLVIDEGQKLRPECLEILRELLNYETNEFKLLQIAIFARADFMDRLLEQPNLADRVNYLLALAPFTFRETKKMVSKRLTQAATKDMPPPRFSLAALYLLHLKCRGYPGQVVRMCREAMLSVARRGKKKAGLLDVPRGAVNGVPAVAPRPAAH
jgi:general secretion pathway protein A